MSDRRVTTAALAAFACAAVLTACVHKVAPRWKTLPETPPMPAARASGTVHVNGIDLYYAMYGAGPPLLLLHGGLANADYWSPQIPALAPAHEVIVMDSRGHGRSTRDAHPYSYDLMASDVIALLDHLHVAKTSIVGWSDGGIIGLDIAIKYPERLDRLFAFGANFNVAGLKPGLEKDPVFRTYVEKAGHDYARTSPTPQNYDAFMAAITEMWNSQPDFTADELAKIVAPTMIADGEYDEAIRREHTEALARAIPGAQLWIMPGVSHFAHWQAPDEYNRAVLAFIDGP
ncbi:MAG: alpha/beta fold hydrolase [Deltaproteobacteria bacterium]|nr:alpha/beta fold hydrolase [Deltaproteobacteria bacterium]